MQERHPHNIRRFADGEAIPDGYVELTEDQFTELEPMTPDERAKWLKKNVKREYEALKALFAGGVVEEIGFPDRAAFGKALERRREKDRERQKRSGRDGGVKRRPYRPQGR